MKKQQHYIWLLLLFVILQTSCARYSNIVETSYHKMDSLVVADTAIVSMIAPYKKQLTEKMNAVVGQSDLEMDKAQPESLLGNWAADAIFDIGQSYYVQEDSTQKIDLAITN